MSLRNVEDLLHERGIDICHETVRFWWHRFGPMFAAEVRRRRIDIMRACRHWRWHLDEVYVKINSVTHYLWRAVDHEGEVLESFVTMPVGDRGLSSHVRDNTASRGSGTRPRLQFKLIKIGAGVVCHTRAIAFQLAEVGVTGAMVRAIISSIRRLRAPPSCA